MQWHVSVQVVSTVPHEIIANVAFQFPFHKIRITGTLLKMTLFVRFVIVLLRELLVAEPAQETPMLLHVLVVLFAVHSSHMACLGLGRFKSSRTVNAFVPSSLVVLPEVEIQVLQFGNLSGRTNATVEWKHFLVFIF